MENKTEEKMLIKVDENIFGKIKKFFLRMFNKKIQNDNYKIDNDEKNEDEIINEEINYMKQNDEKDKNEDKEEIEKKLRNYYESIKNSI